jgi:hypothetical protein
MWFNPAQLIKTAKPLPATFATSATFSIEPSQNRTKSIKVAEVAASPSAKISVQEKVGTDTTAAIRAWLAHIGETDPAIIADVLHQCQQDADARAYYLQRAADELPKPDPQDDRRTCAQCANYQLRVCRIAKPEAGALVVATSGYRPDPVRLVRCEGYAPMASDSDQRTGAERWPGLIQKGGE